jgi:parvulin-like peptidyl-prolyl isomerase
VTRLFYTILYGVVVVLAAVQWAKREDKDELLGLIGARQANAQTPGSSTPWANDPAANSMPGLSNAGFQSMSPANNPLAAPPGISDSPRRPISWPSTSPVGANAGNRLFEPPPPAGPVADPRLGVSISNSNAPPGTAANAPPPQNAASGILDPSQAYPFPKNQTPVNAGQVNQVAPRPFALPVSPVNSAPYPGTGGSPAIPTNPGAGMGAPASPTGVPSGPPPTASGPLGSPLPAMASLEGRPTDIILPQPTQGTEIEGSKIIAVVGTEYVLAGEVIGAVNDILMRNKDKIPPDEYEKFKEQLLKQRLASVLQTKMVVSEVMRKIPEEGFKKFSEKIGEDFDINELPKIMSKDGSKTRAELDAKLREIGSSLDKEKRSYVERQLAMYWVFQQVKSDQEITHQQMVDFYKKNAASYDEPACARWEQIQVRFDQFPSKGEAYRALAEAGNRILNGESFISVATQVSQGPTAHHGGMQPWTIKGSLASEVIDHALFTLPVGQLSPILEDSRSFQIIRVIERREAGRQSFIDVQAEIKKKIKQQRQQAAMEKYLATLKDKVKVWTIFDGTPREETIGIPQRKGAVPEPVPVMANPPAYEQPAAFRYR